MLNNRDLLFFNFWSLLRNLLLLLPCIINNIVAIAILLFYYRSSLRHNGFNLTLLLLTDCRSFVDLHVLINRHLTLNFLWRGHCIFLVDLWLNRFWVHVVVVIIHYFNAIRIAFLKLWLIRILSLILINNLRLLLLLLLQLLLLLLKFWLNLNFEVLLLLLLRLILRVLLLLQLLLLLNLLLVISRPHRKGLRQHCLLLLLIVLKLVILHMSETILFLPDYRLI